MFTVEMHKARETPNTFRFESDDDKLKVLYIPKSAFNGNTPNDITVSVEAK